MVQKKKQKKINLVYEIKKIEVCWIYLQTDFKINYKNQVEYYKSKLFQKFIVSE